MRSHLKGIIRPLLCAALLVGCDDDEPMEPVGGSTFEVTIENVSTEYEFFMSGTFDTPVGADDPGPAGPGDAYEFEFAAPPGTRLTFATMFGQSNDLFFAPGEDGIELFPGGAPLSGEVTAEVMLWDAGTEMNQEPGTGSNQAPRQPEPNTGPADDDSSIRLAEDEFGNLPAIADMMEVTVTPLAGNRFRVRLENVGDATVLETSQGDMPAPFSPGVWVVHSASAPLFEAGTSDRDEGLERIAEEGNPAALAEHIAAHTGLVTPLSPGVWVVHGSSVAPLFDENELDRGEGLESIAEDADPSTLAAALAAEFDETGVFNVPDGAQDAGPIMPGQSFTFTLEAEPGERLSFATMFGQSNDLFYGAHANGMALFDGNAPRSGDLTTEVLLWDAGTELNEVPGAGPNQAPRQSAPGEGTSESEPIGPPEDSFEYPATEAVIRVTITPTGQ